MKVDDRSKIHTVAINLDTVCPSKYGTPKFPSAAHCVAIGQGKKGLLDGKGQGNAGKVAAILEPHVERTVCFLKGSQENMELRVSL